jgi:ATP phosphoribosyltransferase regulatory subunit
MSRALPGGNSAGPLAHPLPAGMRDLLPEEAARRRALALTVLEHFALHGYHLVTPPAFEFAHVLERGLGTLDPSDVLRFVEPESGEVAALRPDVTPQIARMVATRLADYPHPLRLCYEGTVVRRRQGRARRDRQIPQAGVELYGCGALEGDLEVIALATSVTTAAGLTDFVVDVGHASIARALLGGMPGELAAELTDALVQKDEARVRELVQAAPSHVTPGVGDALCALPALHGGSTAEAADRLLAEGRRRLAGTPAAVPLEELATLWAAAQRARSPKVNAALAPVLRLDLGEVRGFAYYTGVIFHILAAGPGEPIGAGGRYDDLLSRFDLPMPATGFALHLEALSWARDAAGVTESRPRRALVSLRHGGDELVVALRQTGITAATHGPANDPVSYARAWAFSHVVVDGDDGRPRVIAIEQEKMIDVDTGGKTDAAALARLLAAAVAPRPSR